MVHPSGRNSSDVVMGTQGASRGAQGRLVFAGGLGLLVSGSETSRWTLEASQSALSVKNPSGGTAMSLSSSGTLSGASVGVGVCFFLCLVFVG